MCPQANVSEIILGGNGNGGTERLDKLIKEQLTVGGYFDARISSPNQLTGTEQDYLLKAQDFNSSMPPNLWLIAGNPSLEVQAEAISQISGQMLPVNVWLNVHNWLKDLIAAASKKLGENLTVFIDCNLSFAVYTEIAMVAAERVIVPCTSDGSSARAINNIGSLKEWGGENVTFPTHLNLLPFLFCLKPSSLSKQLANRLPDYSKPNEVTGVLESLPEFGS